MHAVPLDELRHTPLEAASGNGEEGAANVIGLFINGDGATALCRTACSLKTARACADNDNVLGLGDGLNFHVTLKSGRWVDGAAKLG